MKITLTAYEFADRFEKTRPGQFSREALKALFEHFESIEQDTGEEIEFDPVAISCDFAEYESATEAKRAREGSGESGEPTDEQENYSLNWLHSQTVVIELKSGGVVVGDF